MSKKSLENFAVTFAMVMVCILYVGLCILFLLVGFLGVTGALHSADHGSIYQHHIFGGLSLAIGVGLIFIFWFRRRLYDWI